MKLFWRICRNGAVNPWRYSADYDPDNLSWMLWTRFQHDPNLQPNLRDCGDAKLEFGVGPSQEEVRALNAEEVCRIFVGDKNEGKRNALLKAMGCKPTAMAAK